MIARARLTRFALPLRAPLVTARETLRLREGVLVQLEDTTGAVGYGEAMPLPNFGTETLKRCAEALERLAGEFVSTEVGDLASLGDRIFGITPDAPAARCAIEVALLDLTARRRDATLCELLCETFSSAPRPRERVEVNALIAEDIPDIAARAAQRAAKAGFATFKLKVGAGPIERDVERVAAVRSAIPDGAALRLDANAAWKESEAVLALERLAPFAIEFVEQPVPHRDIASLARVRAASPIPIAADEAVTGIAAAGEIIAAGAADVLVLKPPTLGGPTATLRIAARAAQAGLETVVTSFIDSSVGVAAALHCASALPRSLACGLATASLFEADLAPCMPLRDGVMSPPGPSGLGIAPCTTDIAACATSPSLEIAV